MRYLRRLVMLGGVVAVLVLGGCANLLDPETDDATSRPADLPAEAQNFISLMNDHRESEGLAALEWDRALGDVAKAHSQDMHDRDFFSHTNPDGDDPFDRMAAAGISYQGAAENIAKGQSTGQQVFNSWINSEGHRTNIENGNYTHHGVGYVEDGNYWTHVFARNPSVE